MSTFIQVPNSILTNLPSKRRNKIEAFIYTAIRGQIKDSSRKASYSQKDLATLVGKSVESVSDYIKDLKEGGFFTRVTKKQGEHKYPYNVYELPELCKEYFIVTSDFINRTDISTEDKGLLLFIKANCWKGTNHLTFNGKTTDLAEKLQIGKNSKKLKDLEERGHIRFIGNTLVLTDDSFPLYIKDNISNQIYKEIYDFCLSRNRVPPYKDVDRNHYDKALGMILAQYQEPNELRTILEERCKNLPEQVSLNYLCEILRNNHPIKKEMECQKITL